MSDSIEEFCNNLRDQLAVRTGPLKQYGFLTVREYPDKIHIEYGGNMGASISSVNECLAELGYPPVETLKRERTVLLEDGHPSYMYVLDVTTNLEN
jgi:hypothetical protein